MVKSLIEHGADVHSAKGKDGWTVLHWAAMHGDRQNLYFRIQKQSFDLSSILPIRTTENC